MAQDRKTITGIVTDGYRNRLVGINVMLKGTSISTVTDICGQFTLPVRADEVTLLFHGMSFNDLRTYEITINKNELGATPVIFQLGFSKVENLHCKKVAKNSKRYIIE